jgi:hypothetical protein
LDGNAREYGCPIGTVYKIGADDYSGQCEDPEGVEGCENYYGDEFKNVKKSQLLLGGDDGSYKTATNKPTLRKKIQQTPKVKEDKEQESTSTQKSVNRQQQQQQSSRVRPTVEAKAQEQQQVQQRPSRPQLSQRNVVQTTR